ncbi:MAG: hypothetical protein AB7V18_15755 [Pyrinomonadaceae bacterium]
MLRKYKNEEDVFELLRLFETGTISRDDWRHAEHLVVALCYLTDRPLDEATDKMRSGIFNLLGAFGVDLSKEMPYHETLTVFWMRTAYAFTLMTAELPLYERANRIIDAFDKDYPLRFYSKELLFSDRARAEYVEPDLSQPDHSASATSVNAALSTPA